MKNIIINCFPGESQRNTDLAGLKDLGKRVKKPGTGWKRKHDKRETE